MALITLEQAQRHLRLPVSETADPDLELKMAAAEAIVLDYVNQRHENEDEDGDWSDAIDAWTEETVPAMVRTAILLQLAELWRRRGDDPALERRAHGGALAVGVSALLDRLRDPSMA